MLPAWGGPWGHPQGHIWWAPSVWVQVSGRPAACTMCRGCKCPSSPTRAVMSQRLKVKVNGTGREVRYRYTDLLPESATLLCRWHPGKGSANALPSTYRSPLLLFSTFPKLQPWDRANYYLFITFFFFLINWSFQEVPRTLHGSGSARGLSSAVLTCLCFAVPPQAEGSDQL